MPIKTGHASIKATLNVFSTVDIIDPVSLRPAYLTTRPTYPKSWLIFN